jgi:hypothetical protein
MISPGKGLSAYTGPYPKEGAGYHIHPVAALR